MTVSWTPSCSLSRRENRIRDVNQAFFRPRDKRRKFISKVRIDREPPDVSEVEWEWREFAKR